MNGVKADMVFTDPPYKIEIQGGFKDVIGKQLKKTMEDIAFISDFEPQNFLKVLPTVFENNKFNAYVFCNKELVLDYLLYARENKLASNILIWKKPAAFPLADNHRCDVEYLLLFRKNAIWHNSLKNVNYSRCLEYSRVNKEKENANHPTPKPVELISQEVQISSNENGIVVDLFGGSGSTLIACEQLNRKCYMMEYLPKYIDIIIQRWENFTGEKAIKLNWEYCMVKIQEHLDKINEIKKHINNSKGKQKQQYTKCLHKLQKQALQCYMYMNKDKDLMYIKKI